MWQIKLYTAILIRRRFITTLFRQDIFAFNIVYTLTILPIHYTPPLVGYAVEFGEGAVGLLVVFFFFCAGAGALTLQTSMLIIRLCRIYPRSILPPILLLHKIPLRYRVNITVQILQARLPVWRIPRKLDNTVSVQIVVFLVWNGHVGGNFDVLEV